MYAWLSHFRRRNQVTPSETVTFANIPRLVRLFPAEDEASIIEQNELLGVYLDKLYNTSINPADPNELNTVVTELTKRFFSGKASNAPLGAIVAQKIMYILMRIKMQNIPTLLNLVSNINIKLTQIGLPATGSFHQEMLPIFAHTFPYNLKNTYVANIEYALSKNKQYAENGRYIKRNALDTLANLAKTGATFVTNDWIDAVVQDMYESPTYLSLNALEAMFRAQPHLATRARVDAFFDKTNDEDVTVRAVALTAIKNIFQAKPTLIRQNDIDAIMIKLNDEDDAQDAAIEAMKVMCRARPDLKIDKLTKTLFQTQSTPLVTNEQLPVLDELLTQKDVDAKSLSLKTLQYAFQTKPDLMTEERINNIMQCLNDIGYPVRSAAFNALGTMFEKRKDLLTTERVNAIADALINEKYMSIVLPDISEALQIMFKVRPDLARDANIRKVITCELDCNSNDKTRHAALLLCTCILDADQDFRPDNIPNNLEGQVLDLYMKSMKMLQLVAVQKSSPAKLARKIS